MMAKSAALKIVDDHRTDVAEIRGIRRCRDGHLEYGDNENWKFLCSPITVIALTRNPEGENWGRLLEIVDPDGNTHTWLMPAAMLASRGDEIRQALLGYGSRLALGPGAANTLLQYLTAETNIDGKRLPRARVVSRTGWHGDAFALPDRALGGSEQVIYQSSSVIRPAIRSRSSLKDWQSYVAYFADGNSRLALAICAALASPLLKHLGMDGFAIHFRGGSSIGKTTALNVAGSVWGGPSDMDGSNGYKQTWRATANGFEGLAEAHCDLPLCLDELGQIRGEHAAQVAYQLSGGLGTTRALKTGAAAPRKEWRIVIVSTGEVSLADKVKEANPNQRMMAGQEVRFIDIAADAGTGFGLFEWAPEIDGATGRDRGKELAERLNRSALNSFGHAGPAFIEAFLANRERSVAQARKIIAEFERNHARAADGQVQRVAGIFGLLAAAGELAVEYGVVPWPLGNAAAAAHRCFTNWLTTRGGTDALEIQGAISHLRLLIEKDGNSRFQLITETAGRLSLDDTQNIKDRLGYRRRGEDGVEYLIQKESWKQIMAGRDATIPKELVARGILKADPGRTNKNARIPGFSKPQRVYVINSSALFDEEAAHS